MDFSCSGLFGYREHGGKAKLVKCWVVVLFSFPLGRM